MTPPLRRIAFAAAVALCAGLSAAALLGGFSTNPLVKAIQTFAVIGLVAAVIFGAAIALGLRVAGWTDPESEEDFERIVVRSERLARDGLAAEPDETEFMDLDPYRRR